MHSLQYYCTKLRRGARTPSVPSTVDRMGTMLAQCTMPNNKWPKFWVSANAIAKMANAVFLPRPTATPTTRPPSVQCRGVVVVTIVAVVVTIVAVVVTIELKN